MFKLKALLIIILALMFFIIIALAVISIKFIEFQHTKEDFAQLEKTYYKEIPIQKF